MRKVKSETVIAYLKSKGWSNKEDTTHHLIMQYPKEIKASEDFYYSIPKTDDASDYKEYMMHLVFSIADLYEVNKWDLLHLTTHSLIEIRKEVEEQAKAIAMKRNILAFAS